MTRARLRWTKALALGAAASIAAPARANDPATAQALFDQARKLMGQEKWSEACPKLEESQRLDPGGGTLLHLALCREHEGRIATAWAHYQDALSAARRDARKDRAKIAQARLDALAPRVPRLRVKVAPKNRTLPGFGVKRDDADVGEAQWGEAIPVDPGVRTLAAHATGYKAWSAKVDVPAGGGETTIAIPELEAEPPAAEGPVDDGPGPAPRIDPRRGDGQRTIAIVLAGTGALALAGGAVFGLMAISKNEAADQNCRPEDPTRCSAIGKAAGEDAMAYGNVSTVAFIAGGALLVGGAILYFSAPRRGPTGAALTPLVGPEGGGLSLRTVF